LERRASRLPQIRGFQPGGNSRSNNWRFEISQRPTSDEGLIRATRMHALNGSQRWPSYFKQSPSVTSTDEVFRARFLKWREVALVIDFEPPAGYLSGVQPSL
jgi:hypothetical protein